MSVPKRLIVIAGPTGIGKTAIAIQLAHALQTEIISADSRQVYQQLNIGVGKPSAIQLAQVKHHLIGHVSIHQHYHAADFERDALHSLETIYAKSDTAILCGGTGLYIQTLCDGIDEVPPADMEIRNDLEERFSREGIGFLQAIVKEKDPELAASIDMQNPKRLIRAVEVMTVSGTTFSSFRKGKKAIRNFDPIYICLDMPREELFGRIHIRVEEMMMAGWLDEARSLMEYRHLKALQTVGYKELFDHLEGKTDFATAIDLIKTHTCQYARRQMTWFRKDKRFQWLQDEQTIRKYLSERGLDIQ